VEVVETARDVHQHVDLRRRRLYNDMYVSIYVYMYIMYIMYIYVCIKPSTAVQPRVQGGVESGRGGEAVPSAHSQEGCLGPK
jgi:hypothetical protein